VTIQFADSLELKLSTGDKRTVTWRKDESASSPKLTKSGKVLTIAIASGMDKNTDTAPAGVSKPTGIPSGGNVQPVRTNPVQVAPTPQPKPPPPQPSTPSLPKAKALYPYDGQTQDELSFPEGAILLIHKKDPGGWWEGEINGKRGWIPANYVQEM